MPFQFRIGARVKRGRVAWWSGAFNKRERVAAIITSAARPAPSSHLTAIPKPDSGSAAQQTPSAPDLTKTRAPKRVINSVQKRPVPATYHGLSAHAARKRCAAFERA